MQESDRWLRAVSKLFDSTGGHAFFAIDEGSKQKRATNAVVISPPHMTKGSRSRVTIEHIAAKVC